MQTKNLSMPRFDGWSFAIVNGRLAEIFFETKRTKSIVWGHCYVTREEYTTKKEQKFIDQDTKKYHFAYRNKEYRQT